MDLGEVCAVLVALGSLMLLVRLFRGAAWRSNLGWKAIALALLAASLAAWHSAPDVGGPLVALAWALAVIVPTSLNRRVARAILEQRFDAARRLSRILRVLHPMDGLWLQPRLVEALALGQRGEIDAAVELLASCGEDAVVGPIAALHVFRLRGAWAELLAWVSKRSPDLAASDVTFAGPCLRAFGETGDPNGLVADYVRRARALAVPANVTTQAIARLMVFAFAGDEASTAQLLGSLLAGMPRASRELWLATAEIAAGHPDKGRARLEAARADADPVTRASIERRLSIPLAPATELTPASLAVLESMRREWDQEVRYTTRPPLPASAFLGTTALLFLNFVGFGLEWLGGGTEDETTLTRLGALVPGRVLAGEWWRVATAMFLHYGPVHLALNMVALAALGRTIEATLGTRRFLLAYAVSGLGSMVVCTLGYAAAGREDFVVVGASGAIMGLVGAAAAIALRGWRTERANVAGRRLLSVLAIVGLQSAVDLSIKEVSFTGHISGVVFGFLVVAFVRHAGTEARK